MSFLNNAEHWFARITHEILVVGLKVEKSESTVDKYVEAGATIAATVDPAQAIAITAIGSGVEMIWGRVCAAIHALDTAIAKGEKTIDPAQPVLIQLPTDPHTLASLRDAIKKMDYLRPGTVSVATALSVGTAPRPALPASAVPPAPSQDPHSVAGTAQGVVDQQNAPYEDHPFGGIVG